MASRVERLGYSSYSAYLASPHWRAVKERYAASDRPQTCFLCDAREDLDLHHLTYEHLGAELLDDLVRLCRRCHVLAHVLVARGDITLRLSGLTSVERAVVYREQLQPMLARAAAEPTMTPHVRNALHRQVRHRRRVAKLKAMKAARHAANT